MKNIIGIFCFLLLAGCTTTSEVKAPCDYQATFCGSKIKINQ